LQISIEKCTVYLYKSGASATMTIQTTYTQARANLASLCNEATENREVVIIHRRGAEDVALIAADELTSLLETAHLLRSPANAERLLTMLARVQGRTVAPQSIAELRREVGLDETE
jgi:antitoxin YefM